MDSSEKFEDSDDEMDPMIKTELESLNQAASDVNRLEKEINEARNKYQETFYECSQELEMLRKKCGGKINKARTYYETKELSKGAQSEAMLSARKFQSANGVYMAAKETISLAELRLKDDKAAGLSPAWQEMLNHALIRVMESEQEKTKSEKEHLEKSAIFAAMEKKLHILEKKHKKSIEKAKSYFDYKKELELKLQQIKQSIEDLQQAIVTAKNQYSISLKNLEAISDGIHENRRQKMILMYPREPGVGAEETEAQMKELPSLCASKEDISCSSFECDDSCTDSEQEEGDKDCCQDTIPNEQSNEKQKNNASFCKNDQINARGQTVQTVRVKGKQKLRKTMSLPSYVVEEESESEVRSIEIETNSAILKIETNKTNVHAERCTGNLTCDENLGEELKSKSEQLILDPRALCSRNVVGRVDGDT